MLVERSIINLTVALTGGSRIIASSNKLRRLHVDPYWNINFIELLENSDNSKIYNRYNCKEQKDFVAINGQAVVYGYPAIVPFLFRLKGIQSVQKFEDGVFKDL
jgi:hypothetical protein